MGSFCSICFGSEEKSYGATHEYYRSSIQKRSLSIANSKSKSTQPKAIISNAPEYSSGNFKSKYDILSVLGTGSTSMCHLCKLKTSGQQFACKIIDKRAMRLKSEKLLTQFQMEIQALQSLEHSNIIYLKEVFETDNRIYMVTEIMNGGELFDYVVEKKTLSEVEASQFVRGVISAIAYMHASGIVHRDLKPENLLLTHKSPSARVKIIDFGLSKILYDNETRSFLGTRGYLAPEMLQRQAYSKAVDVWALGVIIYVLLCGCLPFDDDGSEIQSFEEAKEKFNLRFPPWASELSDSAKDLLRSLLEVDSKKRYTAEQALYHPWVSGKQTPNKYLESPKHIHEIRIKRFPEMKSSNTNQCSEEMPNIINTRRQSR